MMKSKRRIEEDFSNKAGRVKFIQAIVRMKLSQAVARITQTIVNAKRSKVISV